MSPTGISIAVIKNAWNNVNDENNGVYAQILSIIRQDCPRCVRNGHCKFNKLRLQQLKTCQWKLLFADDMTN